MIILGIETSCDETSAAIIEATPRENKIRVLSNVVASSVLLHAKTKGIIPEIAARQQIKYIIPVVKEALKKGLNGKKNYKNSIDAIAVTTGPGLIGSLLVGVETAKTLSYVWQKPIIPVNHLIGHIYANFISTKLDADIEFPAIVLIVSGGHTDLLLMKNHNDLKLLGGTRDDAAGEAFDKIARLINLPYPGGPSIEKAAKKGNPKAYNFPRPMIDSSDFDFSFSGLKTAVLHKIKTIEQLSNEAISNLSASVQQAAIDVLISKTLKAAKKYNAKSVLLSGGVAANQKLRDELKLNAKRYLLKAKIFAPQKSFCTDNAAMIGVAAFFNSKPVPFQKITANPELSFQFNPCDKISFYEPRQKKSKLGTN